ncbi:SGNH/GDSL hydrolase family protein [Clostridium sp. 19966]|uniref:SGNH/GDSL hydrolase family protein n=1 Tax=Clostridium sp. 19966 TaxID=2768166 RepID=UPI0028DF8BA8|nr:SGNH/GDSL hydrolase family protein [Clostridium sp. 19966]MDT8715406.1 SGNH/GDSL hydrolase family protein [Clostridium sp. 19966]
MSEKNYNFMVYGDSITKGIVYDPEKSRYVTLKDNFTSLVEQHVKANIQNAGKFGNTILRAFNRMNNEIIRKNPDLVLLEFGGNDCDFDWTEIALNPEAEHKPKTDINLFSKTLTEMIATLKDNKILPMLMTLPPLDSEKYFKWVTKGNEAAEKNVLKWMGNNIDTIYYWHQKYSEAITNVAKDTKTLLIDVRNSFVNNDDYKKYICVDGIHPNVNGHKFMANVILNYIKNNYKFLIDGTSNVTALSKI